MITLEVASHGTPLGRVQMALRDGRLCTSTCKNVPLLLPISPGAWTNTLSSSVGVPNSSRVPSSVMRFPPSSVIWARCFSVVAE